MGIDRDADYQPQLIAGSHDPERETFALAGPSSLYFASSVNIAKLGFSFTATVPGPGPSWDEQVVPALRKRLETESRTLARRISAISVSSSAEAVDDYANSDFKPSSAATNVQKLTSPAGSSANRTGSRSRTYSQPFSNASNTNTSRVSSSSSRPTSPPYQNGRSQSRIPLPQRARSRAGSVSSHSRAKTPISNVSPPAADLWVLREAPNNSRLVNEPAPFPPVSSSVSSVDVVPEPRKSNESEERPFEHWYRGEVSRNGGVGEYRVAKRQEMLDIAKFGHSLKITDPNENNETNERQRQRRSRARADSLGERTSVYLDEAQAQEVARVLDEGPLTDLDAGEQEEEEKEKEEDYYDPMEDYYRVNSTEADNEPIPYRTTTPTPSNIQQRPSRIPQSSTPTQMERGQSEPPYFSPSSATASPSSAPATPRARHAANGTPQSQNRATSPPFSSSKGKGKASPSPSSNSRLAASKATQAKIAESKRQKQREEESRKSIAAYPDPGDDPMHAIPTWTQPVPHAGNWDDVVLPVVARKRGLDGQYEHGDGSVQIKKKDSMVAPAPGTFGFDHSKYRPPREDGSEGESIPLDEFGARNERRSLGRLDRDGEEAETERLPTHPQTTIEDQRRVPTGNGYPHQSQNATPFASYTTRPPPANVISEQQQQPVPMTAMNVDVNVEQGVGAEDEHKGGCCGHHIPLRRRGSGTTSPTFGHWGDTGSEALRNAQGIPVAFFVKPTDSSLRMSKSANATASAANSTANAQSRSLHDYQLGDSLGKGAFGQVYRALNWATGETVAIKQIALDNIPSSQLSSIMSEISLLKNLRHPNIVKYKGFVKTRMHLYIILEFCENGSLAQIGKRFGKFPENLVGVYVNQVLEGLCYLHDQGVIHRDIKGANILTNKDGTVKLADFGVASSTTTPSSSSSADVVGSPYWMAPEVIEQSGATTASDIWSLGCVVIELLDGSPPYSFLDPMPALWRIVQDDCPPIPEGASAAVKDFLMCCFQKDPNLRIGARKLLRHPWMVGTRANFVKNEVDSGGEQARPQTHTENTSTATGVEGTNDDKTENWTSASTPSSSTLRLSKIPSLSKRSLSRQAGSSLLLSKSPTQTVSLSKSQVASSVGKQRQSKTATPKAATLRRTRPSKSSSDALPGAEARPMSQYGYDEAVLKVQEWNQALSNVGNISSLPSSTSVANSTLKPHSLAVPVPGKSAHNLTGKGSASAGSAPTIRPFQFTPALPSTSVTSVLSSSSSSASGSVSSGSSDQSKTIKPIFTAPVPTTPSKKNKKTSKPQSKGPTLITPSTSLNPLSTFNRIGGIVSVLADQQKQLAFVEEDESNPNRDRWDDDFELGDGDDDFAARSKIDITKSRMEIGVGKVSSSGSSKSESETTHLAARSSGSGSDGEDETVTYTSKIKPQTRERDDRTIRASPGTSFARLPHSSGSAPSPSRLSPSHSNSSPPRRPTVGVMNRSTSDSVTRMGMAGTTYHAISEAEEENYDDDFLDDDDTSEDGDALLEKRVNEFKARTASQRLKYSRTSSLSRPLFHPDDIKSALFPHVAEPTPASSPSSAMRPSLHGRTYSASAAPSPPPSSPFTASASGMRRPQLTLPPTSLNNERLSPGPMTAPLPNMDEDDQNVWGADYEYDNDYDYSSPLSAGPDGSRNSENGRSVSAGQRGSVRSAGSGGGNGSGSVRSSHSAGGSNGRHWTGTRQGSGGRSVSHGVNGSRAQRGSIRSLSEKFDKYTEHPEDEAEEMDFEYEESNDSPASTIESGDGSGSGKERQGTFLKLNSRLSNRSWMGNKDESDEEDVFAEFDEPFAEDDFETHLQRDKHARLSARVGALVDDLSFNASPNAITAGDTKGLKEERLKGTVEELLTILITTPEMQPQFVSSHGMLAILEVLEGYQFHQLYQQSSNGSSTSSSPNPSPSSRPVPLPGSTPTVVGSRRSGGGIGMVGSLGLSSLASLGSLGLGSRISSAMSSASPTGTIGITGGTFTHSSSNVAPGTGMSTSGRDIILQLLQVVNLLVSDNMGVLESFCLIGGIPVIIDLSSCRGLKVLVDLLDEDCSSLSRAPLVNHALNGIATVFDLQSPTTKNDFCRMFVREGLLDPLSGALLNVMVNGNSVVSDGKLRSEHVLTDIQEAEDMEWREDNSGDSADSELEGGMKMKIIKILLVFSQVSQSDLHVRNAVGTRKVVRRLLRACELLEPECLVLMLKAVKHLSMNVALLDVLQNANAIEVLVRILEEQSNSPYSTEVSNHIFQTCFNLCRLNKPRQEEAAQAGIIPCLQRVAETQSPLKQFALPILCDMASAGKSCRMLLWQHNGLKMYLKLLADPYFQVSALESILSWLQDEPARVEMELVKSFSLILDCFVTAKANSFESLLELFLKLTRLSIGITTSFSRSAAFFRRVADRLAHYRKPVVHPNRGFLVEKYGSEDGLLGIVEGLSRGGGDGAVLVRELAKEIIPVLRPGLKPLPAGSRASGRGVTPKRTRRTASEASVNASGSAATMGVAASSGKSILSPTTARIAASRSRTRHKLGDIPWQGSGAR
ncbi:hypothetical protein D9757_007156 [Collybiopsis confluens]|uniref:non-specific serine/threonine protein kinase n=1 Tax=Collybiopsis confluens TaxID=2823264 RepID=A0A8H5M4B3_9AGAR|nr:hypothetical protein D9757_007156 [Collybiopsis confluens]